MLKNQRYIKTKMPHKKPYGAFRNKQLANDC